MLRRFCSFSLLFVLLVLIATACSLSPAKPTVVLNSPPHGSQFHEGEPIAFQTTATDRSGIARVELLVNGSTVQTDVVPGQAQTTFTLVQHWTPTQGTHTIAVRAFNAANVMSEPAVISITVLPAETTPTPVPIAVPPTASPEPPTPTSTATATATTAPPTAAPPPPSACTNNAAFVADVTVPDGTLLAANQTFNKIWRVRNSGTCTWGDGYLFVFIGGEAMATTTAIAVPYTAPGATADLLVAMAAPAAAGIHTGQWRLKAPAGNLFGVTVNVTINVLGSEPPPPSGSTCTGTPNIDSFTASPTTINAGQTSNLQWGSVTNADSVEIDQGIGGVATPGNTNVSPGSTTTYTLIARCGANAVTRSVTITVQVVGPPPTAPDLYVSEYSLNPATPVQGQNVHVRVGVYNKGNAAAGAFSVQWWASTGASPAKTWSVASLPAMGGQILEFDYAYPSWYANITTRVKVDTANTVAESDESNNIKETTIQVTQPNKPDLYVSAFSVSPNPPTHDAANVTVSITVYNKGNAAATTPFIVQWYAGSNYPSPAKVWTINSMAAHGGQVLTYNVPANTWVSPYPGGITTRVRVDPTNTVSESDETNNVKDLALSKVN